jgi:endonuclease/exonuclease/phosphatase family metal-dependent hydrolase
VILTGDFNAGEENSATMFLTGRAPRAHLEVSPAPPRTGLVDSFRVKHPDESDVGTFHAFKGAAGDTHKKIDYILVPANAEVLDATIDRRNKDGRFPSDHYAVTARVRLN